MEKKEKPDKGVFTWGAFTAIMIIVVVAAVLVLFFNVKLGDEETNTTNKNVINESMIDKGVIKTNNTTIRVENGTVIDNTANEVDTEAKNEVVPDTTNEVATENTVTENTVNE